MKLPVMCHVSACCLCSLFSVALLLPLLKSFIVDLPLIVFVY